MGALVVRLPSLKSYSDEFKMAELFAVTEPQRTAGTVLQKIGKILAATLGSTYRR
jgi:hypothetical protein